MNDNQIKSLYKLYNTILDLTFQLVQTNIEIAVFGDRPYCCR